MCEDGILGKTYAGKIFVNNQKNRYSFHKSFISEVTAVLLSDYSRI